MRFWRDKRVETSDALSELDDQYAGMSDRAVLEDVERMLDHLEERLVAIQSWQASVEKHLLAKDIDMKPGPIKFVPDATDMKLRGECFGSAVNMNKGMSIDLVIIEAEKIYQFLKGQHIAHGNKVH